MKCYQLLPLVFTGILAACGEKPPVYWMYGEYESLHSVCSVGGKKIERKSSTASLTYTWSCPYPEDFDGWLSSVEKSYLTPRGWESGKTEPPYIWKTYCSAQQNVVMRIVKVNRKPGDDVDRVWLSIRFPGDECPKVHK